MGKQRKLIERWAEDEIGTVDVKGYTPVPVKMKDTGRSLEEILADIEKPEDDTDEIEEV